VKVPLVLGPYEAKVIVVGPLAKKGFAAAPEPSFAAGETFATLDGDWKLDLNGKQMTTALKPWEELGTNGFAGPATYTMQFTAVKAPKGKRVFLEIADVHDYAKVTLNGKDVGACSWQPYRWDVTGALKKGANNLAIEVDALSAQGRGGFGGPPPGAAAPAPAAAGAGPAATGAAGAGPAGAAGAGARRRPAGAAGAGAAGAPAGTPPAGYGAAGGGRGAPAAPPTSGLMGSVKLVAY
jgi:hypothetical protein